MEARPKEIRKEREGIVSKRQVGELGNVYSKSRRDQRRPFWAPRRRTNLFLRTAQLHWNIKPPREVLWFREVAHEGCMAQ